MTDDDAAVLKYVLHTDEQTAYRLAGEAVGAHSLRARIRKLSFANGLEPAGVRDDALVVLAGAAACVLCLGVGPSLRPWNDARKTWRDASQMLGKEFTEWSPGHPVPLEFEAKILSRERVEVYTRIRWGEAMRLCLRKQSHIAELAILLLERREVDGDTVRSVLRKKKEVKGEVRRKGR